MLKQSLSQKMLQKLSPQQIQLMKLLQIPTATLDQRIQEEIESNPALEEGEEVNDVFDLPGSEGEGDESTTEEVDYELDDYLKEYIEDDPASYKIKGDFYSEEDERSIPVVVENSFHDHLERQLGMLDIADEEDQIIASQIIGSIDADGYLRRDPLSIIDDLMFSQNIDTTEEKVGVILEKVKKFDPPGVGARDLQECLITQLEIKIEKEKEHNKDARALALTILNEFFEEFTRKHYEKMKKNLEVSDSELKDAMTEILKLNPKPASSYTGNSYGENQYIVPDFIIHNRDGELELTLNSKNAPDLKINDQYMDMLQSYKDTTKGRKGTKKEKEAILFIKQKIASARWFIEAIKQRQNTLSKCMYAIMQFQYDYFLSGDESRLRPMILKDIAEITQLDISTVSRVANSKFVQTEFGTKILRSFFSESVTMLDGKEVSTLEVKNILTNIISREQKIKPLSDERIKDLLLEKGYNIARRTVAKYREQLNIPVARLRKELR